MAENKVKFTEERLRNFVCEEGKSRTFYTDAEQQGLRLAVTPTGTKTFQARAWHRIKQRPVTLTLGGWPGMPLDDARQRTKAFLAEIASGNDPHLEKVQQRSVPTVAEMLRRYLDEHSKPHKRSYQDDERMARLHLIPDLGNLRVDELLTAQVRSWHAGMTQHMSTTAANRHLALLRAAYNVMLPDHPNPCRMVKMYREESRDRFLQPDELGRFFLAVEAEREFNPDISDYVLLSIFTGARRGNVLSMRWKDIDLTLMQWRIPAADSKNKSAMVIPLVDEAVAILAQRKATTNSVFVLAGPGKTGHLQEPRKGWLRILKRAGLEDVRLHDLRRTLGSWQTIGGASTAVVGRTLGHKNAASTAVYARMTLDPVRDSMRTAIDLMKQAAAMPETQKVITIRKQG